MAVLLNSRLQILNHMSKENIDAAASDQNEVQDTEMTSPENSQGSQQDNNSEFNDAAVEDLSLIHI